MKNINTLIEFMEFFKDEETCIEYVKSIKFKDGEYCPHCGCKKVYTYKDGKLYKCSKCRKQFTIKVGTIFGDSKIPLKKWLLAIFLLWTNHKGISSVQLAEQVGVTQKTAWFMEQRIREAYERGENIFGGIVEVDETYIGGKDKNKHSKKKSKTRGGFNKEAVLGIVERRGNLRLEHIGETNRYTVSKALSGKFNSDTVVITDETTVYDKIIKNRKTVNHSKNEYVNSEIYTNTIEGAFGIVKRTIFGIYHFVSRKHLQRYMNEIAFRYNIRRLDNFDKVNLCLYNMNNRLRYGDLIGCREQNEKLQYSKI